MINATCVAWIIAAVLSGQTGARPLDLAQSLAAGRLRAVNRVVAPLQGVAGAVHVAEHAGDGVVWIEGSDFTEGTIEIEVRGRDAFQRSFLGIAFHRKDDAAYEAVYLRPFNFRASDPARHQHAVQYMTTPDYEWPKLREQFPEEFENPVDQAVSPTDWVALRVVVHGRTVQVFVGPSTTPALEARKLGALYSGLVGLWTGNNSDGDFRNVRITASR
jgi:hypothetical protein